MSTLFQRLWAKQKSDAAKRAARLAKRRGYDKGYRERGAARRLAESRLADLPVEVVVAIEEAPEAPPPPRAPGLGPVKVVEVATVEDLVARLTAIRERLFWLQSVWATSLSSDVYQEAEKFRAIFRGLCGRLRQQDPAEADRLIGGHEALLLSEPAPPKPKISLVMQSTIELIGEIHGARSIRPVPKR